jgi:hypothetical protein
VAALLPAAAIGSGLAAYNHARFGSIFEFGFNYGQNGFFSTKDRLFSSGFIWTNIKWYYLTPPSLSPYFPYIFPINGSFLPTGYHGSEAMHGQMHVSVLAAAIGLSALVGWRRIQSSDQFGGHTGTGRWRGSSQVPSGLSPCSASGRIATWWIFIRALVLGLVLITATLAGHFGPWWRRTVVALGLAAAGVNVLIALQQFDEFRDRRPQMYRAVAQKGNLPSAWFARLGWLRYGPLRLQVTFRAATEPSIQPVVALGTPEYSDSLCVVHHPGNLVQFKVEHSGYGGPSSALIPIQPGRSYEVTLDMGSLYPPLLHPFFDHYDAAAARLRKTATTVTFDGKVVLEHPHAGLRCAALDAADRARPHHQSWLQNRIHRLDSIG